MKPQVTSAADLSGTDEDRLLASLKEEWPLLLSEPVPPSVARAHIAMAAAAASSAGAGPAAAPSTKPAPLRWRRRFALATVTSTFLGQLLLGTAALAAVGAGAAAAGVLPAPLQSAVAELAGEVGFVVPSGAITATPAEPGEPGEGATPAEPATPPEGPETGQTFGLDHRPITPPGSDSTLGHLDEFAELRSAVEAIRSDRAAGNTQLQDGHGRQEGVRRPPASVPRPSDEARPHP